MTVSQSCFHSALRNPTLDVPDGLRDGRFRPAGRRFNVYRNNVTVSLTQALQTGFPVVAKLLGKQNMDSLARLYLRAHPPASPLMMHYGDEMPDFLDGLSQVGHLPYLADIARLEIANRQSYHAADSSPASPAVLERIPPDALFGHSVSLAPSARLVRSDWPIFDIWQYNTMDGAPKPRSTAQDVLVVRPEFDPIPRLLPEGAADWLSALADGASMSEAYARVSARSPGFDPGPVLSRLLEDGVIISLKPKSHRPGV